MPTATRKHDRDPVVAARHHVGERVAEQQAGDRHDQRGLERVEQHAAVERDGEYPPIVLERYRRVGHAEQQDVSDRNDEQHDDREHGRRHQQPRGHLLAPPGIAGPMEPSIRAWGGSIRRARCSWPHTTAAMTQRSEALCVAGRRRWSCRTDLSHDTAPSRPIASSRPSRCLSLSCRFCNICTTPDAARSPRSQNTATGDRSCVQSDLIRGNNMTRRHLVSRRKALALGAGAVFAPYIWPAGAQTRTVYVNSYGGVWETSWKKAFFDPFTAQTGIQVKTVPGRFVRQAQGAGADPKLRVGCHQPRRRGVRPGGARRAARKGGPVRRRKPASCRRTWSASTASPAIRSAPISSTARTGFRTAVRKAGRISGT